MTLRDTLDRLRSRRLDLSDGYLFVLSAALGWFRDGPLDSLSSDDVAAMMHRLRDSGKSAKTIRSYRQAILYLMHAAGLRVDARDVRPPRNVRRRPTAWTVEELGRLVSACRSAPWRSGWGPPHWEALTLTAYDTGLRIGTLLLADVAHLDGVTLYVPGEHQKGREDAVHHLHPDTSRLLLSLPRTDSRMFPWPFCRRVIWKHYGEILRRAGLPDTSRDKFHKLRRTSYTYVAKEHGIAAASEHAAHKSDLSAYYLDKSHLNRPNPLEALPRPK